MRLVTAPGVFAPISDSRLLAAHLTAERPDAQTRVLDLCTGSGYLAVAAAQAGASDVTAVDLSRRAVLSARVKRTSQRRARSRAVGRSAGAGPR